MERRHFAVAACGFFAVALSVLPATAATFVYDPVANGGLLPASDGWTEFMGGSNVESVTGDEFFSDDANAFLGNRYRKSATLIPQTDWQMRAHVRLLNDYSSGGNVNEASSLYNQMVSDGTGANTPAGGVFGFGLAYDSGLNQTKVYLRGSNNGISFVAVTGLPQLEIVVTKTSGGNPAGRGDDPIVLQVYLNNVLQGTLASTLGGGILADSSTYVAFGNFNGAPQGTYALEYASWGIGENAPTMPVPEPAALSMAAIGLGTILSRRRR